MTNTERVGVSCRCSHVWEQHGEFQDSLYHINERKVCLVDGCGCQCFKERSAVSADEGEFKGEFGEASTGVREKSLKLVPRYPREDPKVESAGPICSDCVGSKYPGILWLPDGQICACEDCKLFVGDREAACFLSAVLGVPIHQDEQDGAWFTPMDEDLIRSMSKAFFISSSVEKEG